MLGIKITEEDMKYQLERLDFPYILENGNVNVTLNKGDIMLERGKEYLVGKDLMPGKYTILSGDENVDEINIRIGGIVKAYKHDTSVVLTKGDKISAVSANVVLR